MVSSSSGPGTEPEFMTVAEVATRMRVSKMTVYRLLHGGEVPAVDEPVDGHLRHAHDRGDFGDGEEPHLVELALVRHVLTPIFGGLHPRVDGFPSGETARRCKKQH